MNLSVEGFEGINTLHDDSELAEFLRSSTKKRSKVFEVNKGFGCWFFVRPSYSELD